MRIPSFNAILDKFLNTSRRFPIQVFCSILLTGILIILIQRDYPSDSPYYHLLYKLSLTAILGFFIGLVGQIVTESFREKTWVRSTFWVISPLICLAFYLWLPKTTHEFDIHLSITFFGSLVFLHLLISYIPYIKNESLKDFWNYNKTLLINFLEASFFSFIIFGGLLLALTAIENLFDLNLGHWRLYQSVLAVAVALFHPIYFLSRYPDSKLDDDLAPKRAFLFFSKYISIPLVLIYAMILYAYIIKIIAQGSWPKGWVSSLSLGFSVIGVFAYLLSYFNDSYDKAWIIRVFKKYFFYGLLPVAILVLFAIGIRLGAYGITESRYIVATLGLWLLGISIYFILSKKDDIRWIPMSLSFITLIAVFGPLNMHSVSLRNQLGRLEEGLTRNGLLDTNGFRRPGEIAISAEEQNKLVALIDYLGDRNHLTDIQKWNSDALTINIVEKKEKSYYSNLQSDAVSEKLGLQRSYLSEQNDYRYFYADRSRSVAIDSYQTMVRFPNLQNDLVDSYDIRMPNQSRQLDVYKNASLIGKINLTEYINRLASSDAEILSAENSSYLTKMDSVELKLLFDNINLQRVSDGYVITSIEGLAFIKVASFNDEVN